MCGIAGMWSPPGRFDEGRLSDIANSMAGAVRHRGPDAAGIWTDPEAGIALGHRRLSIIDLSTEGAQPMSSSNGRYQVVFNGEIYNFRGLKAELLAAGHTFRGNSDTEVLLAAVLQWGFQGALQRFVGMFAFALWDRESRVLHIARDRMGEKPLYYGWVGESLVFGSELKSMTRHPDWEGKIDRDALTLYLRYNYVPAPHSIYQDIYKLPAGTFLSISSPANRSGSEPVAYWSVAQAISAGRRDPFMVGDEEAVDSLDAVLGDAVEQQMVADVPLGAFLSGGIDSSTVVALMQSRSRYPVRTFTIGFHEGAFNEAEHAGAVARHLGTDHTELYVTASDSLGVIPRLPSLYDEPFADSSQIPTFLVSELARRSVTVSLSGDGGDELFGGYTRYLQGPRIWNAIQWAPHGLRTRFADASLKVAETAWRGWERVAPAGEPPGIFEARLRKVREILVSRDRDDVYLALVSSWRDPESGTVAGREIEVSATAKNLLANSLTFSEAMMFRDAISYLPDDILVKVDRAAMGVSLETRAPMLDHRVVEFAWRLPYAMKYRDGKGKWLLRKVLDRYVPRSLIERPKMGFGVPVAEWLRGPLRGWAEELLSEARLRDEGYFDPAPIRERWLQHVAGTHDWNFALWGVLMFQAWLEQAPVSSANRLAGVSDARVA